MRKTLEDGGEVEFSWRMHADPDRILSLDTEAERGVRLRRCRPDELELELPESHAQRVEEGHIVVGSRFAHRCEHLADRHLYHRVVAVRRRERRGVGTRQGRAVRVSLATEELPSFTHAVEFMSFNFSYMPVEARDLVPFPEMRTDFGQHRPAAQSGSDEERRLLGFPKMPKTLKKMMHIHGVEDDSGDVEVTNGFGDTDSKSGMLHFEPKQVSNFGWNWNFFMNTTQEPKINVNLPGAKGIFEAHRPYIKVHAGFFLNFTSKFSGIIKAPKVFWRAGIDGHGYVQARILTKLNTTSSAGIDPFKVLNYPTLRALERPRWFQKVDFAAAMVPLSFEPGFQFNAQLYHSGTCDGAVSFGGHTHGTVKPTLTFDSLKGFDAAFQGRLLDTEIWPPLWMIFTKHFELGVTGVPAMLMKGDFLGFEKATTAIEMMPYLNITITREGHHPVFSGEARSLTVYPLRIMGLPSATSFNKKYKVKIQANDMEVESGAAANWGQVEFHEHVSSFDFGQTSLGALKEHDIIVTLVEVDEGTADSAGTTLGSGSFRCQSKVNGECSPSPSIARITSEDGTDIAAVQLVVLWDNDPKSLLASKIRGLSVAVNQLAVRPGGINTSQPLSAHLVQGGMTYVASIHKSPDAQPPLLSASTTFEFRPAFLDAWKPCSPDDDDGPKCESAKLAIFAGSERVAEADFPQQQWTMAPAATVTGGGSPNASTAVAVPLSTPGNATDFLAVLKVSVSLTSAVASSAFLQPRSAQQVPPGGVATLTWTIRNVQKAKAYTFHMMAFKLQEPTPEDRTKFVNYPQVGTADLVPLPLSAESVSLTCQQVEVMGIPASEAPCSFTHGFAFSRFNPAIGDLLSILLEWSEGDGSHVMYTPPFEISSSATPSTTAAVPAGGRRLQQQPATVAPPAAAAPTRHPSLKEVWNEKISEHQKSCDKRDLHFALGAGILMRGRIKNGGLLKGLSMMGGHMETPELTTGYKRLAAIKPDTDAQDLLPDKLCEDGLCTGALPGCSPGNGKKKFFPKLIFNMNRPYHFNKFTKGKFHGMMKRAMAYAFSAMPMMLNVAIKQYKETGGLFGPGRRPVSPGLVGPAAWENQKNHGSSLPFFGSHHSSSSPAPSVQVSGASLSGWDTGGTSPTPAPTASPAGGGSSDVFNQWYNRRLRTAEASGEAVEAEPPEGESLEGHQVAVSFQDGVHFKIDRPLVELMIKHGYFQDMEDDATKDLGPLKITSFSIEDSGPSPDIGAEPSTVGALPAWSIARLQGVVALAGAAVAGLALVAVTRRQLERWRPQACSREGQLNIQPAE